MSYPIRPIRTIERTSAYAPIRPITAYGYFPYRDREAQFAPDPEDDWNRYYKQAADSAQSWIAETRRAEKELDQLIQKLGRQLRDNPDSAADLDLHQLPALLNRLEKTYARHSVELKPELWDTIEQALRHPATDELGLRRADISKQWILHHAASDFEHRDPLLQQAAERPTAAADHDPAKWRRLLLGSDGLLTTLKHAISYSDELTAIELVEPQVPTTLPYSAYYGAVQDYVPLPYPGLILNQYV
jgi:hypothetical protein